MIDIRAIAKSDLLLLRWPALVLLVSGVLAGILYFALGLLSQWSAGGLAEARAEFDQVSSAMQQIAQEEQTVIRYIDRFSQMEADGVMSAEDRLDLIETIAALRDQYLLYPIEIDLSEQTVSRLQDDPYALIPVGPVDLLSTQISLSLPLLHEQDLISLTANLLDHKGLLVPQSCTLRVNDVDFSSLSEHLQAQCRILWYSFNIDPQEVPADAY